jgi:hypothetical protein
MLKGPFTPRQMVLSLSAIVLAASAPVLSIYASSSIAGAYDCRLNENSAHSCMVGGMDLGELLANMFVLGWLALVTVPLGALALLIWTVVAAIQFFRRKATLE